MGGSYVKTNSHNHHQGEEDTSGRGTIWGRPTLISLNHTDTHRLTAGLPERCQVWHFVTEGMHQPRALFFSKVQLAAKDRQTQHGSPRKKAALPWAHQRNSFPAHKSRNAATCVT